MFDHESIPLHWVNRLGFLTRKMLASDFKSAGQSVSPEEWAILLFLWKYGDRTSSEIADATIKDRTTVTRLLDGMVAKGLVQRQEDRKDRRRSLVKVTERGRELQGELVPIARNLIETACKGLSVADIEVTTRSLKKMTENLMDA